MSKSIEELHADLETAGWQFGPGTKETGVGWYAWRRLGDAADCACNDKPPSLIITPYELHIAGKTFRSTEFEITGEAPTGRWLNFKAYSVPIEEAMKAIPECAQLLRAAWNAACQVKKCREE